MSRADYYMDVGVAVDQLMRACVENPRLELRMASGVIRLFNDRQHFAEVGIENAELTSSNWLHIAAKLARVEK